jgi:hypothetical protein
VVMDAEVWTDAPREVRFWTHRQTGVVSVEAYASDGPAWAPEKLVRAILRVSYRGKTFDLDAEPAVIQSGPSALVGHLGPGPRPRSVNSR